MADYRRSFKLPRIIARFAKGQLLPVRSMDLSCPTVLRAQSTSPSVRRALEKNREISTYVAREGLAPGLGVCLRRTRYRGPEFNKSITPVAIPSSKSKIFFRPVWKLHPRGASGPVPPPPCGRESGALVGVVQWWYSRSHYLTNRAFSATPVGVYLGVRLLVRDYLDHLKQLLKIDLWWTPFPPNLPLLFLIAVVLQAILQVRQGSNRV